LTADCALAAAKVAVMTATNMFTAKKDNIMMIENPKYHASDDEIP
jgi:hypothetical protein